MPGKASIGEAAGAPLLSGDADFGVCVVGYCSLNSGILTPWTTSTAYTAGQFVTSDGNIYSAGSSATSGATAPTGTTTASDGTILWTYVQPQLTGAYGNASAAASALGNGDAVDLLLQGIVTTPGNPAPTPVAMYITPSRTAGSYPLAANVAGVTGTALVSNGAAPTGTFQPWLQIVNPGSVGTTGITAWASLGGPNSAKQLVSLGTASSYSFPASDGWGTGGQAQFLFGVALTGAVSVASGVFGGGGSVDTETLILTVGADGPHTLTLDVADNAASSAAFEAAVHAQWPELTVTLSGGHHLIFTSSQGPITVGAGTANTNLGLTAATTAPTFNAGDTFYSFTLPPQWTDADLFAAGPPALGAFAAIAASSQAFGMIWISEPVAAGDFATLVAGLNYLESFGKRVLLTIRFRDPLLTGGGETDAAYVAAFQTWRNACLDNRIQCVVGSGVVTDAFTGRTYIRSGEAPLLARTQSFVAVAGQEGERIAQNPGWVARGPLEGFSLRDINGQPVGHDELVLSGIESNAGPVGGGICFCFRQDAAAPGTYVTNRVTVLYPVDSEILTPMDRRVANGIETVAVNIAGDSIGGADIFDTATDILDEPIAGALAASIAKEVSDRYGKEFQNAADRNLVVINGPVTVNGANVGITGQVNALFYGYTDAVALTFVATR